MDEVCFVHRYELNLTNKVFINSLYPLGDIKAEKIYRIEGIILRNLVHNCL